MASKCIVCENLTNDVCDLGMTEIIDTSGLDPALGSTGGMGDIRPSDKLCISVYGSGVNISMMENNKQIIYRSWVEKMKPIKVVFLKPIQKLNFTNALHHGTINWPCVGGGVQF